MGYGGEQEVGKSILTVRGQIRSFGPIPSNLFFVLQNLSSSSLHLRRGLESARSDFELTGGDLPERCHDQQL